MASRKVQNAPKTITISGIISFETLLSTC